MKSLTITVSIHVDAPEPSLEPESRPEPGLPSSATSLAVGACDVPEAPTSIERYRVSAAEIQASLLNLLDTYPAVAKRFFNRLGELVPEVAAVIAGKDTSRADGSQNELGWVSKAFDLVASAVTQQPELMNAVYGIIMALDPNPEDEGERFTQLLAEPEWAWLDESSDSSM